VWEAIPYSTSITYSPSPARCQGIEEKSKNMLETFSHKGQTGTFSSANTKQGIERQVEERVWMGKRTMPFRRGT